MTKRPLHFLLLLPMLVVGVSKFVSGQYYAFPTVDAQWLVHVYSGPTYLGDENYHLSNVAGDTTINGDAFTKLYRGIWLEGALRDNLIGQVYFHDFDDHVTYLLYDFEVSAGDTIFDVYTESQIIDTVFVVTVDSITHAGELRRRVGINTEDVQFAPVHWVQGIGSIQNGPIGVNGGGILSGCPCSTVSASFSLYCMSHIDTIRYGPNEGSLGDCFLVQGISESPISRSPISVAPNPSNGVFMLSVAPDLPVLVFDAQGRLVKEVHGREILIVDMPSGVYYAKGEYEGLEYHLPMYKID